MQFRYKARSSEGEPQDGVIEAASLDLAVASLQRRNFLVISIEPVEGAGRERASKVAEWLGIFEGIPMEDVVILTRQLSTLFEARVPVVESLKIIIGETENRLLRRHIPDLLDDIQGGMPMSQAMARQEKVFSRFYVAMIKSGEESGKLEEIFRFLADYLERSYELTRKARNALIYPAFILITFIVVMVLMMTLVIPKLADMLAETGQSIPVYTKIVIGLSQFVSHYILLLGILVIAGLFFLIRILKTPKGQMLFSRARLQVPTIGAIYTKLFLSRIADNLSTMLRSGIQMLRGLEITGSVVEDRVYERVLTDAANDVKGGLPVSEAFRKHSEIPGIVVAMIKIGEETGNMGHILETMARFYRREVNNAIDTLVSLIEPFMIVVLAVGVAILLASVLIPIYNIASGF